jgi:hypothetical protein
MIGTGVVLLTNASASSERLPQEPGSEKSRSLVFGERSEMTRTFLSVKTNFWRFSADAAYLFKEVGTKLSWPNRDATGARWHTMEKLQKCVSFILTVPVFLQPTVPSESTTLVLIWKEWALDKKCRKLGVLYNFQINCSNRYNPTFLSVIQFPCQLSSCLNSC